MDSFDPDPYTVDDPFAPMADDRSSHGGTDWDQGSSLDSFDPGDRLDDDHNDFDNDAWSSAAKKLSRAISQNVELNHIPSNELFHMLYKTAEETDDLTAQQLLDAMRERREGSPAHNPSQPVSPRLHDDPPQAAAGLNPDAPVEPGHEPSGDGGLEERLDTIAQLFSTDGSMMTFDDVMDLLGKDSIKTHFSTVLDYVMVKLREQSRLLFHTIFPYHQLQTMIVLGLVQIVSLPRILAWVPLVICYVSFCTMIYFSLQMYQRKKVLRQMEIYEKLLKPFVSKEASPTVGSRKLNNTATSSVDSDSLDSHKEESMAKAGRGSNRNAKTDLPEIILTGSDIIKEPGGSAADGGDKLSASRLLSQIGTPLTPGTDEADLAETFARLGKLHRVKPLYRFRTMEPYISFFTAVFMFVLSFALCGKSLPNCLFLCSVSLIFCAMSFLALSGGEHLIACVGLLLDCISCAPVLMSRFDILPSAPKFLHADLLAIRLGSATIHVNLGSTCFVAIICLYLTAALCRRRHREMYKTIVPHLVSLFWWQTAVMLALAGRFEFELQNIVLTVGLVSLVLWPTVVGITVVAGVIIAQLRDSLNYSNVLRAAFTLFILFLPFLYKRVKSWAKKGQLYRKKKTLFLLGFYLGLLLMSISLLYHGPFPVDKGISNLTWQNFNKHCGGEIGHSDNSLDQQMECSQLKGVVVAWKGTVHSVRIVQLQNSLETLLDYMPNQIAEWMRCFYGNEDKGFMADMHIHPQSCSITSHNVYTFEVNVAGPWGESMIALAKSSISLVAAHKFKDMLEHFREGDVISFIAIIDRHLNRYPPNLKLLQLQCISCRKLSESNGKPAVPKPTSEGSGEAGTAPLASRTVTSESVIHLYSGFWSNLFYSCKFLFNFLFAPLVVVG